jgi:radical SAM superfamily enzyme YgiQ (UPF0313 family)
MSLASYFKKKNRMKILFVQPNSTNEIINSAMHIYNFEPLGIYYLAASVKDCNDINLIDLNNELILKEKKDADPFSEAIKSYQPRVVAFSALTSVRTGKIKELSRRVKSVDKNIITLVGGVHASLWPSDFEDESIDVVITKDSLQTFSYAIQLIEQGHSIGDIKKIVGFNKTILKLNNWPLPFRKLGDKYRSLYRIAIGKPGYSQISKPVASVKTSSGCPFRCDFCCLWKLYPRYEIRKVESVVKEIASLKEDLVFFADDESLINVNYMLNLASVLLKSGVKKKYIMYGRADTISKNPILIEKLAEAGLKQIWIGIEGSTDDQLKEYRKKNTTMSHPLALNICKRNGVDVHATALVNQDYRKEDFDYMLKYTKEILGITSCHFFVLTPFKGTDFYKKLKKNSSARFLTDNSDHFSIRQSVLRPKHMTIEEFHQKYADLQRDFNSDSIPFYIETSDYSPEYRAEFETLKRRNERFYDNILNAHRIYQL